MIKHLRQAIMRLNTMIKYSNDDSVHNATSVLLVAIAKDEGAYLSEWLFHHLYFGFDHISVYINNSTDNSWDIANNLSSEKRISFHDGNKFFKQSKRSPQVLIYETAFQQAKKEYSHVMFLDIDEFFTPLNFKDNIKTLVNSVKSDVCCLEWLLKIKESSEFGKPFDQIIYVQRAKQVKSIIKTSLSPKHFNPHNVYSPTASYELANGCELVIDDPSHFSLVPDEELNKSLKAFHVVHRITRSEREYIALLNRGRPVRGTPQTSQFKDNRGGILQPKEYERIDFSLSLLQSYQNAYNRFCRQHQLGDEIEKARSEVISRYNKTIEMIENASGRDTLVLRKILRNVTDTEVIKAYKKFQQTL